MVTYGNLKNVSAGIFIQANSVLITKRADKELLAGYWEFPGGKQEREESIFECLEREILEELNVRCKANKVYFESIYNYDNGTINLIAILSDLLESNIELTVHDEYKWVNINDLINYKFAPADIPIVKKLMCDYGRNC